MGYYVQWGDSSTQLNHGDKIKVTTVIVCRQCCSVAESEELDRMVGCIDDVYRRRMLKVNVSKISMRGGMSQCNISPNGKEVEVVDE